MAGIPALELGTAAPFLALGPTQKMPRFQVTPWVRTLFPGAIYPVPKKATGRAVCLFLSAVTCLTH